VVAYSTISERDIDLLDGILATASGPKAVALRFEPGFEPRSQGVFNHQLPHPVTDRRDAERPSLAVRLRDLDAPHRGGFPGVIVPEVVDQLRTLVRRGQPFPVNPWRVPSAVDLGDTPDRH
jgi:hypothetical protein